MVNIQDETDFSCQCLNRDVWSNAAVKSIVEEYFVFWQVSSNCREGLRYNQFYPVPKFPYIAILDPRTGKRHTQCLPNNSDRALFPGEKLKCWHMVTDSRIFCELVTDFLQDHPTPTGDPIPESIPVPAAAPIVSPPDLNHVIADMSEDEQLKAAIAASLQEPIKICDDDDDIESLSCDDDDESLKEIHNHFKSSDNAKENPKESEKPTPSENEDYTAYLGVEKEMADLVLRFPAGEREVLSVPSDSKLKVSSHL